MTISVIVPVYNEQKYIGACLESLLSQTKKPLEIIVVDDGSFDASMQIIKNFPVKLVSQKHLGPGVARNAGAKIAQGEILVFVDADMTLHRNYLRILVRPIETGAILATFTTEERVANLTNYWARNWDLEVGGRQNVRAGETADNFRAIKKKLFFKLGGFADEGYGEDTSLFAGTGYKAQGTKAVCYHYNPESMREVFLSARWMGKGEIVKNKLSGLVVFSVFNSFRKGFFKLVFDLGVWIGIWENLLGRRHVK